MRANFWASYNIYLRSNIRTKCINYLNFYLDNLFNRLAPETFQMAENLSTRLQTSQNKNWDSIFLIKKTI